MNQRVVSFRTRRFEARRPGAHFINPTCFGEDLVAWLRPALEAAGFAPGEPIQEDYGWGVWTTAGGRPYWIAASRVGDDPETETRTDADGPAEWCVIIAWDPGLNLWRRLTQRPRPQAMAALAATIDAALRAPGDIEDIDWTEP